MQYPVNLVLDGRECLVVGGGKVAVRKVEGLLDCGARVRVVAPRVDPALRGRHGVVVEERRWEPDDLAGMWLVIAATDDPAVNRSVYEAGQRAGVWVNGADDPANCSFTLPSVVRRGDLQVTVSTGGRSPALATWLRRRLEGEIGPEYAVLLDLLASEREGLKAAGRSTEGLDWQSALDSDMLGLIRNGDLAHARERLQTCLSSSSD
ncbi:MAG TPA: bifunctional precorrin-2 dehydrogenase/sirohydrochlorin ferrochelatase [Acidimicrobiales bacterium]|nr:bifunctional precorrin-2 dehydrogenase/sirohydrochlorin ferrochelatase [Acidimicrobiales bacterium]